MKKRTSHLLALGLALALALGLWGCTGKGTGDAESQRVPTSEVTGESAAAYPLTITNSSGAEIILEKEPQTIISAAPSITEIVYVLGAEDKLVARTDYCDYPAEVSGVESIGSITTPDMERIVELDPDLVITSTHFNAESAAALEGMGITVLTLSEQESFEGSYAIIEKTGQALNRRVEASAVIEEMQAVVNEVAGLVEGLEAPSVYYVVGFGEHGDYTAGGDTFMGKIIEMAGGYNIAGSIEGWSYNLESLLEADPAVIIVSTDMKKSFETAAGYSELTAVKEGNIYEIDTDMLDRQGVRNTQGLKVLAEILHPEAFELSYGE